MVMHNYYKITKLFMFCGLMFGTMFSLAQNSNEVNAKKYEDLRWREIVGNMPTDWYASNDAIRAADSVLKYQTQKGGWAKNQNFHLGFNQKEWAKMQLTGIGATFDNGATLQELRFLAKMYNKVKDQRYKSAFYKGFDYILEAQYDNGGWPQFYPFRKGGNTISYNTHITYNDNALVNIMRFLKDIVDENPLYTPLEVDQNYKQKAKQAFDKGINCIINTQIKVNNQPTIWCAQHDEVTLAPAKARAYELASFSGAESANIVFLLMDIKNPSKEIVNAVKGAVNWFETHKIEGVSLKSVINSEGLKDVIVIEDKNSSPLWARFYDLETELPFFCDRDGIKKNSLAEIGYNRRTGYSWYTSNPSKLIEKFPEWSKKWNVN
jgi:PelA/Pel-15E family pectate lyase